VTASRHYATIWESIAARIPDSPALQHGAVRRSWSAFEERSARLAGGLQAHGVGAGDGIAQYLYNCPELFEGFFAGLKIRAIPSNINYRYGSDELVALLDNSEATVLFFDASLGDQVSAARERAPRLRLLVEVGGDGPSPVPGAVAYEELVASAEPAPPIERPDDDQFLSYTGGTTGLPKGVRYDIGQSADNSLRFRDMFLGRTDALDPVTFAVRQAAAGAPMRGIPASPLMHSTGFIFASLPVLIGGGEVTTLVSRSFDAHELFETVDATGAQLLAIVGDAFALPMVRALDEGRPDGGRYDGSSVLAIVSAGVAWSAHIKERLLEHLPGATLLDACGSTEGVGYGFRKVRRGDVVSTANFDPSPGLKVLGPDGKELAPGEIGMLAGPTTATGYHHDPEKTASTFFRVGDQQYAMPGDLGRIEPDGTVTLVGRGVTTINTGGEKVFPAEVEEAIATLAAVDDCLVLGVPDERFGQAVAALVVGEPQHQLVADDVAAAVRSSLAGYKVPRRIRFVEAIPRLANGKVDFEVARALAGEDMT
jgi:acyl-CoA synthetase (AMP-forming)/AMP-acid ligase II